MSERGLRLQVQWARTDPAAFEQLLERFRPTLRWVAGKYWAPGLDRSDLLQEAWIGFHKAVRDYLPAAGTFQSFVRLTVERQIITAIKTATRQKHLPVNDGISLHTPVGSTGESETMVLGDVLAGDRRHQPEQVLERRQEVEAVSQLPLLLSDVEQFALAGFVADLSYHQVADAYGVGAKAIDNAIQRARRKARAHIIATRGEEPYERPTGDQTPPVGERPVLPQPLPGQTGRPDGPDGDAHRVDRRPPHRPLRQLRGRVGTDLGRRVRAARAGGGMSLVEAVEAEKVAEVARHRRQMLLLDDLEQLAGEYAAVTNGVLDHSRMAAGEESEPDTPDEAPPSPEPEPEPPVPEPVEPEPDPPRPAATPGRRTLPPVEELAPAALTALQRTGRATKAEIGRELGLSKSNHSRARMGEVFDHLLAEDAIRTAGTGRGGHPFYTAADEDGDASPEHPAAAGNDTRPRRGPADNPARAVANMTRAEQRGKELLEALGDEELQIDELAARLGISWRAAHSRLTHLAQHGRVHDIRTTKEGRTVWARRLTPAETPGITVRHAGGNVTETQVTNLLAQRPHTLHALAAELGVSAADVGLTVASLEHFGRVCRIADGKYELLEQPVAA